MSRIVLLHLSALVLLAASACGTPRPAVAPSLPAGQTAAPAATSRAAAPTAASVVDSTVSGTPVAVTLSDNKIDSSLVSFRVGVPYTFVIKNTGAHEACFSISEPVAVTGSLGASAANALLAVSQHDLVAGGVATAKYTFLDAAAGIPLEFSCLMRRHYDDGMRLTITVTK